VPRFEPPAILVPKGRPQPTFGTSVRGEDESGPERETFRIAAAQDGVISTRQLLQAGFSKAMIATRVRTGLLRPLHRGVYACGAVAGPWWEERAALLACGPLAALSHPTALAVYEIRDRPAIVHVTRRGAGHSHRGILVHRATLCPDEIVVVRGLRVTSPARTLQDVAPSMPAVELARLIEEMQVRRLITDVPIAPNRPGAAKLRALQQHEPRLTRSEAERKLLALIRAARLPTPRTNVKVGRYEVDMLWPGLIVEIDGFAFHSTRAAFERDRIRDAELLALGYRVIRITWRRLVHEPEAVIATIAAALSAARSA
jgi:very-short-patch-repair endonuclease